MRRRSAGTKPLGGWTYLLTSVFTVVMVSLAGCGGANVGQANDSRDSVSGDTESSTTVMIPTAETVPETTTASAEPSPPISSPEAQKPERLMFEDVSFIELLRPSLLTVSADSRRILSPAIDRAVIEELLALYSVASVTPNERPTYEGLDLQLVIHLRDSSAVDVRGSLAQARPGLLAVFEGNPEKLPPPQDMDAPRLLADIEASELLALVHRLLAAAGSLAVVDDNPNSEAATLPAEMPADFGFVAAFGVYGKMVLDTFSDTFHKDMVLPQYTTSAASVTLSPAELAEAYDRLLALDVLSYPTNYLPAPGGGVTPNEEFYLRLHAGSVEKEIRWDDGGLSGEPKAIALREWFKWLEELVYSAPEYKLLPDFRGGYA